MTRYLLLLAFLLVEGCQRSIDPGDPLYQTWRWTKTRYEDGRLIQRTADASSVISFRPNGTILYGVDGRYAACCFPNRFRRQANRLYFSSVDHIPVPRVDNAERCYSVDCIGQGDFWQINILTDSSLTLKTNFGELICIPY
ncbi:hypothetical protein [Spirosoma sp. KUDC1026]|uniref:hypothetical protein n=1 Tax=Spirosoma sp. KUDC1026 TaxID=2745947 RepID=UPI00159BCF2F|nr:hypothetical protein [Spirosoma sp. KUDC1026]QKZ11159.1 hypothetical protein HU175_00285 [Spirosoma sp. KUDC1026]